MFTRDIHKIQETFPISSTVITFLLEAWSNLKIFNYDVSWMKCTNKLFQPSYSSSSTFKNKPLNSPFTVNLLYGHPPPSPL